MKLRCDCKWCVIYYKLISNTNDSFKFYGSALEFILMTFAVFGHIYAAIWISKMEDPNKTSAKFGAPEVLTIGSCIHEIEIVVPHANSVFTSFQCWNLSAFCFLINRVTAKWTSRQNKVANDGNTFVYMILAIIFNERVERMVRQPRRCE